MGYSGGQKFGSSTPLSFSASKSLSSSAGNDYTFAKAVKSVGPFVVGVSVKATFYGIALTGCGLLIDEETVLTCAHCVVYEKLLERKSPYNDSVKKVQVTLSTGRCLDGVVGAMSDGLALVILDQSVRSSISIAKLPDLGTSYKVRQGEPVCAFGSLLKYVYRNTVTGGIVSHVNRSDSELSLTKKGRRYLQIDCPINKGNVGGPICNVDGQVIGLVFMSYDGTSFDKVILQGVSFAIPIEAASVVLNLKKHKK